MIPKIISRSEISDQVVDYSLANFKKLYEIDGCIYYYAVFAEMFTKNEALENTGNKLVVLLHSKGFINLLWNSKTIVGKLQIKLNLLFQNQF